MGVRLSEMKAKERETHIVYDGDQVDFAYRPNEYTMNLEDEVSKAAQANNIEMVSTLLEPIVVWWDVLDDKGKRLAADAATMRQFPLRFLLAVMAEVSKDQDPEPEG